MKTRIYNFIKYVFDEMPYYKVFVLFTVLLQLISIPLIMFLFEKVSVGVFSTHDEAELACLRKLIEIVKKDNQHDRNESIQ